MRYVDVDQKRQIRIALLTFKRFFKNLQLIAYMSVDLTAEDITQGVKTATAE